MFFAQVFFENKISPMNVRPLARLHHVNVHDTSLTYMSTTLADTRLDDFPVYNALHV